MLPDQLIALEDSAKYCPEGINQNASGEESFSAILVAVANLNRMALGDPSLCAGEHGPSFRNALFNVASGLAELGKDRPVRYVELGPEPNKSRAILTQMVAAGVQLA